MPPWHKILATPLFLCTLKPINLLLPNTSKGRQTFPMSAAPPSHGWAAPPRDFFFSMRTTIWSKISKFGKTMHLGRRRLLKVNFHAPRGSVWIRQTLHCSAFEEMCPSSYQRRMFLQTGNLPRVSKHWRQFVNTNNKLTIKNRKQKISKINTLLINKSNIWCFSKCILQKECIAPYETIIITRSSVTICINSTN